MARDDPMWSDPIAPGKSYGITPAQLQLRVTFYLGDELAKGNID